MHPLEAALREEGYEVHFDNLSQTIYSVDASIYEVKPLGVALPRSVSEIQKIIQLAVKFNVPIIPRGAATGITGGCLGKGLVLDLSKHLNQIISLDIESQTVVCQPGVIQDVLNQYLDPYRLGPDTSTGDRATLGGMAANNAAGARSLLYGKMVDAVEEIELALSTGELVHFAAINETEWQAKLTLSSREGEIYRAIDEIRKHYLQAIDKSFPPLPRRASGYNLDQLLKPFPLNLAKIIVGSEGSLGVITELKLAVVSKPKYLELCLFRFNTMLDAMEMVTPLLKESPISLELIDEKILAAAQKAPSMQNQLHGLLSEPAVLLIAEFQEPKAEQVAKRFSHLPSEIIRDPLAMQHVWAVRKSGLGLLLSKRTYSRAVAFIEDLSIPPEKLTIFMGKFMKYLKDQGKGAGIYGHAGAGCLHIRPYMDLKEPHDITHMQKIMLDVARMVQDVGGTMSGEHGDGLIRSWLNEQLFGKEVYEAFQKLKNAFDPLNLMNPHKVVNPLPVAENLRQSQRQEPKTFLSFKAEGGLALSADMCNGNGLCRKSKGVMCPSFQVTGNEYDSTRARANALRHAQDLADPELQSILDLCIECKGCKGECPSQVDMAKMKSETLYHFQEKYGYSLRSRLFAHIDTLSSLSYPFRSFYNHFVQTKIGKRLLKTLKIVAPLPLLAPKRFTELAKELPQPEGPTVVLLSDTYTEFYCPEVGVAAMRVLNRLGFKVIVPPWTCCGRPALSKGFLPHAKKNATILSDQLRTYAHLPIIGLEPSCLFTLIDDYPSLDLPVPNCELFDSFVTKHLKAKTAPQKVVVHGHCHHKALHGMQETLTLLKNLGLEATEILSGCCGMAGSFGYETEHLDFSQKIGELNLLPFVRKLPEETFIISNGFSCRAQINRHTNRKAMHLAEYLDFLKL